MRGYILKTLHFSEQLPTIITDFILKAGPTVSMHTAAGTKITGTRLTALF
uniref:Uncharacterized protein n=1 Tax=Anguilla anguilla TaxID=7936 RepID=A0A0E9UTY8_ANGAN